MREGKILGAYLAQHFKGVKAGLLYSTGEPGRDGIKGLRYEVSRQQIAATQRLSPDGTQITRQVRALKASGARVVAAFTGPADTTALLLAMRRMHYNAHVVAAASGADPATLASRLAKTGDRSLAKGIITDDYLPAPTSASSSWIALFHKIHQQYIPRLPFGTDVVDGMAAAYTFAEAMLQAGHTPTRQGLIQAISAGLPQGPAVAPLAYAPASHAGVTGAYIGSLRGNTILPLTPALTTNDTATGPVAAYPGNQPRAPASGIPQH